MSAPLDQSPLVHPPILHSFDQLHACLGPELRRHAGAVIERLSDPVSAIGDLARLANEADIIPSTEVIESNPALDFLWWKLSRGLYCVFDNLGFSVEMVKSAAIYNPGGPKEVTRPTIIARRIAGS